VQSSPIALGHKRSGKCSGTAAAFLAPASERQITTQIKDSNTRMDEEAFISEMKLHHADFFNQFQRVVGLYKEAIVSMQGQLVQRRIYNLKEQLKNYEMTTVNDRFKCTQNRIKMLRSLHKSMTPCSER